MRLGFKDYLFHAVGFKQLRSILEQDALSGYSTHRIHQNGTVPWLSSRVESPPNIQTAYLDSYWFFGVCLTRSLSFARKWNEVVIHLDKQALKHRHRIVPYNWYETRLKAEFEEYLITSPAGFQQKDVDHSLNSKLDESDAEEDQLKFEQYQKRVSLLSNGFKGQVKNLHRYVKRIEIVASDKYKLNRFAISQDLAEYMQKQRDDSISWIEPYCCKHGIDFQVI